MVLQFCQYEMDRNHSQDNSRERWKPAVAYGGKHRHRRATEQDHALLGRLQGTGTRDDCCLYDVRRVYVVLYT